MYLFNSYRYSQTVPPGDPLWSGLIHYYNFDNNLNDSVGSADLSGSGPYYTTGKNNQGVEQVMYSSSGNFQSATEWSINLWFRNDAGFINKKVFGQNSVGRLQLFGRSTGSIQLRLSGSIYTIGTLSQVNYTMISIVVSQSDNSVKLYVNNSLDYSNVYLTDYDLGNIPIEFDLIGVRALDETGIWTRALSQAEITELYNSGTGKFYSV